MMRTPVEPVFVDRKTAAARIMISVETFDTWVRAGFIPRPHIDCGQIVRWHWPSLEEKLAGLDQGPAQPDPFMEGVARVFANGGKRERGSKAEELNGEAAEMARRYEAAQAQWRKELPSTSLSKRERYCLSQLGGVRAGELVSLDGIRGVSFGTAERLEIRGMLEALSDGQMGWVLTATGAEAVAAVLAGREPQAR